MMRASSHPEALFQLRFVTRILALIILFFVFVGFFLPTNYQVERQVQVNAPLQLVLNDLFRGDTLPQWMFIPGGEVASFDSVLQEGDQIALLYNESDEQGYIKLLQFSADNIRFDVQPKPNRQVIQNTFFLQSESDAVTSVRWVIKGDLNAGLLSSYIAFFANKIAGDNFETSLNALKELMEHRY